MRPCPFSVLSSSIVRNRFSHGKFLRVPSRRPFHDESVQMPPAESKSGNVGGSTGPSVCLLISSEPLSVFDTHNVRLRGCERTPSRCAGAVCGGWRASVPDQASTGPIGRFVLAGPDPAGAPRRHGTERTLTACWGSCSHACHASRRGSIQSRSTWPLNSPWLRREQQCPSPAQCSRRTTAAPDLRALPHARQPFQLPLSRARVARGTSGRWMRTSCSRVGV